jgi:hypothetical protein
MEDEEGEKIPDQFELAFPREKIFISYKVYNTSEIEKNIKNALTRRPYFIFSHETRLL